MNPTLQAVAPFLTTYAVIVALLLGSFINLAADRLPLGESVITPRSHCRACGRVLNVVDLVPVAGYLIRGGRCATCFSPIGVVSPLVEGVAGLCMVIGILGLGLWPGAVAGFGLVAIWGVVVIQVAMRRERRDRKASQASA